MHPLCNSLVRMIIKNTICIGNSMVSKLHEYEGRVQFEVSKKLTSVCFFQIAQQTILLENTCMQKPSPC
jgi:hypothetical protein